MGIGWFLRSLPTQPLLCFPPAALLLRLSWLLFSFFSSPPCSNSSFVPEPVGCTFQGKRDGVQVMLPFLVCCNGNLLLVLRGVCRRSCSVFLGGSSLHLLRFNGDREFAALLVWYLAGAWPLTAYKHVLAVEGRLSIFSGWGRRQRLPACGGLPRRQRSGTTVSGAAAAKCRLFCACPCVVFPFILFFFKGNPAWLEQESSSVTQPGCWPGLLRGFRKAGRAKPRAGLLQLAQ